MDNATQLALRAIVRGLFHTDAISADQDRGICTALKDAAGAAQEQYEPVDAKELLGLCKGIKSDTAVS